MARVKPLSYPTKGQYLISESLRRRLQSIVGGAFHKSDFERMAEALSFCEGAWQERRLADDGADLERDLGAIATAADDLVTLLMPNGMNASSPALEWLHHVEARLLEIDKWQIKRAERRGRYKLAESDNRQHARHRATFEQMTDGLAPVAYGPTIQNLRRIRNLASIALRDVQRAEKLTQGGDAEHVTVLLRLLTPIFRERGLRVGNSATSQLVDVACELAELLPAAARPTDGSIHERLKKLRAAERRARLSKNA